MIRLALRVRRAEAELVLADLLDLAPSGVEEVDLPSGAGETDDLVEYAVYGAPGELPALPDLRAVVGGALVEISTSEIADDWSERWRQFHQPVLIEAAAGDCAQDSIQDTPLSRRGPCLFVRPPWEAPSDRLDALEIVIDPAQAFGTGAHATTRLCLELLLQIAANEPRRQAVLDIGCGSGVLAIAARKLGYCPVIALDNDRESVLASLANAAVNDVEIQATRFDLRAEVLPLHGGDGDGVPAISHAPSSDHARSYDAERTVVLANLLRPLLLELAETMTVAPRHLIASGLLCEQAEEVARAFAKRLGLNEQARLERGEWAALWLTVPGAAR